MVFTIPLFFKSHRVVIDFDDLRAELSITKYRWNLFGSDLGPKTYRVPYVDVLRMQPDAKHQVYQTSEHGYSETTWHTLSIPNGKGSSVKIVNPATLNHGQGSLLLQTSNPQNGGTLAHID